MWYLIMAQAAEAAQVAESTGFDSNSIVLALIAAASGGFGVEVVKQWLGGRKERALKNTSNADDFRDDLIEDSRGLRQELRQYQQTISDVQGEVLEARAETLEKIAEVNKLQESLTDLNVDLEAARSDLEAERARTSQLQVQLDAARSEQEDAHQEAASFRRELSRVRQELSAYKARLGRKKHNTLEDLEEESFQEGDVEGAIFGDIDPFKTKPK